jgi:hypothetical protein
MIAWSEGDAIVADASTGADVRRWHAHNRAVDSVPELGSCWASSAATPLGAHARERLDLERHRVLDPSTLFAAVGHRPIPASSMAMGNKDNGI